MQRLTHFALALLVAAALPGSISGNALAGGPPAVDSSRLATTSVPAVAQREVFGFALASSLSDPTFGYPSWNFSLLTTVAFFGLHVQDDGTFASDSGATVWNSSALTTLVSALGCGLPQRSCLRSLALG